MSSDNTDVFDLKSVNLDGLIHEDVMSQIWDISHIPLPFTDMIGSGSHDNQYFSWTIDKLREPVTTGQQIDGSGQDGDDSKLGRRIGNHSEIRTKNVEVSTRAQAVDTIGYANALAYQVTERQKELRRDVEATALSNNGSVEGTDAAAGVTAGLNAWITTLDVEGNAATDPNVIRAGDGDDGGWDATASNSLVAAATLGTGRAITETEIRDVMEGIYSKGGSPDTLMVVPKLTRKISEYMFTSSARIATMINDGPSGSAPERAAQGSVDLFITDYGTLKIVPNRLQPMNAADNCTAFVLDASVLELSYLSGYAVEPLAKVGLSDKRMMSVDWALCVKNWDAIGGGCDIDPTLDMTA